MKLFYKLIKKMRRTIETLYKNYLLNSMYKASFEYGLNKNKRNNEVIVSLTTYPKRFPYVHICLKSILRQKIKPDRIIVWLDEDVTDEMITDEMKKLIQFGVQYKSVPGYLKPHKKYIHAMNEYPEAIIITVDDDVYTPFLISSLLYSYKKHPDCVSARRAHLIQFDQNKKMKPYEEWLFNYSDGCVPRGDLFACGVGGVLYPPHILPKDTFNYEKIKALCLEQDDVWLKFMEAINNVPTVWTRCLVTLPPLIEEAQETALHINNLINKRNDYFLKTMMDEYPECIAFISKGKVD